MKMLVVLLPLLFLFLGQGSRIHGQIVCQLFRQIFCHSRSSGIVQMIAAILRIGAPSRTRLGADGCNRNKSGRISWPAVLPCRTCPCSRCWRKERSEAPAGFRFYHRDHRFSGTDPVSLHSAWHACRRKAACIHCQTGML